MGSSSHSLSHALSLSCQSWPLFRDEEGNPRTARDSYGDPDEKLTVSCSPQNAEPFKAADSTLVAACPARPCMHSRVFAWRDTATLKHFAERGMNDCGDGSDPRKCVTKMVTPRVEAAAQLYFGCDTLQGAELENQVRCSSSSSRVWQLSPLAGVAPHTSLVSPDPSPQPTTPCVAYGSHWEQRLFMDSVMSSTMGHNPKLNPITLAMFEDSGWYLFGRWKC